MTTSPTTTNARLDAIEAALDVLRTALAHAIADNRPADVEAYEVEIHFYCDRRRDLTR